MFLFIDRLSLIFLLVSPVIVFHPTDRLSDLLVCRLVDVDSYMWLLFLLLLLLLDKVYDVVSLYRYLSLSFSESESREQPMNRISIICLSAMDVRSSCTDPMNIGSLHLKPLCKRERETWLACLVRYSIVLVCS